MSDADHISAWMPEQDQERLAILGKLAEESAELSARAARCIIHGIGEIDPDSHISNGEELAKEMADVIAALRLARKFFDLKIDNERYNRKRRGYEKWLFLIRKLRKPL